MDPDVPRVRVPASAPRGPDAGLRLGILGIVVASLFSVLVARLVYLQVLSPGPAASASEAVRLRVLPEPAPRGRILDAKGRVLVDSRTELVVTVDRQVLDPLGPAARRGHLERLAARLQAAGSPATVADIERRLVDPRYNPLRPVPVATDVPAELLVLLAERADEFPGVSVTRQSVRRYPNGAVAAHVLGYVGRITAEELVARAGSPIPYEIDSDIGRAGVERTFEDELRGRPGERTVEVDRRGRVVRVVGERRPVPGHDIQLTIDLDVQRLTEARLAGQLEALRGGRGRGSNEGVFEGRAGAAVVVDPRDGAVTALASYPTFDPAEFANGISTEAYRRLSGDGDPAANALINRAIAGQYAPGSTFKLVSAYAALDRGVITPATAYDDQGTYTVGDSVRRNAEGAANGVIGVTQALTVSSDVFFYWIGDRFWSERDRFGDGLQEMAQRFGFGEATGVELPGEAAGVVPDPERPRPRGDGRWYAGDSANVAIGQGDLLATPLQLANAYAAFAAGGVRHRPSLLSRVVAAGTDATVGDLPACAPVPAPARSCVVRRREREVVARVELPAGAYDAVRAGLAGAVGAAAGTATDAFAGFDQAAYPVLGKTGTVESGGGRADHAAFVGVGPAGAPRDVAAAYLEHAGFGAEAAAPVVRSILELASGQQADPCRPTGGAPVACRPLPAPETSPR